jgi:hypothetical protein
VPGERVTDLGLLDENFHLKIIDLKLARILAQIVDLLFQVDHEVFVEDHFHCHSILPVRQDFKLSI